MERRYYICRLSISDTCFIQECQKILRVFFVVVDVELDVELKGNSGLEVCTGTDEDGLLSLISKLDVKPFTILLLDFGEVGTEMSSHL